MSEIRLALQGKLNESFTKIEIELGTEAFVYSSNAHAEEKRDNGDWYVSHTVGVALILLQWGIKDIRGTVLALLHDVLEKALGLDGKDVVNEGLTFISINMKFGLYIATQLRLLTKVNYFHHYHITMLGDWGDWLTIFVKFADLLHNILTLEKTSDEKKRNKAYTVKYELPTLLDHLVKKIKASAISKNLKEEYEEIAYMAFKEINEAIKPYLHLLEDE